MAATVPRWKTAIVSSLSKYEKSVVFQLSTIDSFSSPGTNIPHVRSHIFRDFLSAKSIPSLPLLLSCTDIRTPKASQIINNPHVEIAWWIEDSQEQFRIAGLAGLVSAPDHTLSVHFGKTISHGETLVALKNEGYDWEARRREMFDSMSGHMKASWCRPPPGSKLEGGYDEAKKWPEKLPKLSEAETEEDKKNLAVALNNFALVVIDPSEVDYVELGVMPNQRTKFRRIGVHWKEEIVVP